MHRRAPALQSRWIFTILAGAALLCAVALVNGGPIVFPDTGAYLLDGERLVRLTAPVNVRPVFYGLAVWPLHWERSLAPIIAAQGVVVAHLIYLTLRAVGALPSRLAYLGLLAGLVLFTPLSWYVAHVLPDIFSGVLLLSVFLLGVARDRLSRGELIYLILLAAAATAFHLTHVALAAALAGMAWLAWLGWRSARGVIGPGWVTAPVLLALAGLFAVSLLFYGRVALAPKSPPFLMARLITDGPGRDYLHAVCGERHYQLCPYLGELPDNEEGIIWGFLPQVAAKLDSTLLRTESGDIVRGTVLMFPLRVARGMAAAAAQQFVTMASQTAFLPDQFEALRRSGQFWAHAADDTLQSRGSFEGHALDPVNTVHAGVAAASLLACLVLAWRCGAAGLYRPVWLVGVIVAGLVVNAVLTGALGGVFGRYQGRLIWLLPFAAAASAAALLQVRRVRQPAKAGSA
ncbi:MAG: hypothetical protein NVSMB18_36560 [Acetobacteraceae bacterium]